MDLLFSPKQKISIPLSSNSTIKRLREIDFLRGVAIILVLLRHQPLFDFTTNMGWIGVDLFFVLSGFLVSGLLFNEFIKYGNIKPGLFLIRRGFKIYPIYYIACLLYFIPFLQTPHLNILYLIGDITFTQNYINGWGYLFSPGWSLAVEEHFYFALAIALWIGLKTKFIKLTLPKTYKGVSQVEIIILCIMLFCLCLRITTGFIFPNQMIRRYTMTHLRIDSLLAGVFVAYLYYFRKEYLLSALIKNKIILFLIAVCCISWTPFIDPLPSFFVLTFGFTLLYFSFSLLLLYFLLCSTINEKLNRYFSKKMVNLISKIGYCSYSIYIVHRGVDDAVAAIIVKYHLYNNHFINFFITSFLSVLFGMLISNTLEKMFLKIRDKYFPSRGVQAAKRLTAQIHSSAALI